jgi:hypothetical protein
MITKDIEIMIEIYRRAYAAATPSANFDELLANAEIDKDGRKLIPFNDYELEDDVAKQIIEDAMKEFKVPKWKRKQFTFTYWLGCSPKSK